MGSREALRGELYFATAQRLLPVPPREFCRWETIARRLRSESNAGWRRWRRASGQASLAVYAAFDRTVQVVAGGVAADEDVTYLLEAACAAAGFAQYLADDRHSTVFPLLTAHSDLAAQRARVATKQLTLF